MCWQRVAEVIFIYRRFVFSRLHLFVSHWNLSFGGWLLTGFFLQAGSLKLSGLILSLFQIIMFGMGTELSIKEFLTVLKKPRGILIGILCNYTIMPVFGFMFAIVFSFPKEIAAGIILVGCCPSGLASYCNVICYPGKPVARKVAES